MKLPEVKLPSREETERYCAHFRGKQITRTYVNAAAIILTLEIYSTYDIPVNTGLYDINNKPIMSKMEIPMTLHPEILKVPIRSALEKEGFVFDSNG